TKTLLPEHHADASTAFAEFFPNARAVHQRRGLLPEQHLAQIAEEEAVADHSVRARRRRRAEGRLDRAGEPGENGFRFLKSVAAAFAHEVPAERRDVDDEQFFPGHGATLK